MEWIRAEDSKLPQRDGLSLTKASLSSDTVRSDSSRAEGDRDAEPRLPCHVPPAPTSRWLPRVGPPRTHGSCWHDPQCCPRCFPCFPRQSVPTVACWATGPSRPFAGLNDILSGLFSFEGNWGLKAQCGWNGSLWAQHKRGEKQELLKVGISP